MKHKHPHILVAAGPTREYLDPVRYISNDSSGQMGFALAGAARKLGFRVTLISGPVNLKTPFGIERIDVSSGQEMQKKVNKLAKGADIVIMAAAVADWRPQKCSTSKIKKQKIKSLKLTANPDILAELGKKKKPEQILVGFALESSDLERNALKKLKAKKCDWIVANKDTAIGADSSSAVLFSASGQKFRLPKLPKEELAMLILSYVLD